MSRSERVERVMAQLRCSREYAVEYLMEREYNQMSHGQAVSAVNEKLDRKLSTDDKGEQS